jgi:hypothetical protein
MVIPRTAWSRIRVGDYGSLMEREEFSEVKCEFPLALSRISEAGII